ncbi:conserved hypothetical protein [Neospora caninum Liverpool]|uniref:S1 motif domain-containing protein n=1 Tax=Neospora caninum (strain Liverpool) TaxID=572307 RepID=F0VJF5_NEOCL|nr:conserved hypothetical protein [Neospora caninum Liverpool]CBZ53866.1 conserved hypothetical protein [Neospora caninum Liverpool]|eukprot:XP_003883898.1 conserved hypothetical protein [Neospora caninum Liverpool]
MRNPKLQEDEHHGNENGRRVRRAFSIGEVRPDRDSQKCLGAPPSRRDWARSTPRTENERTATGRAPRQSNRYQTISSSALALSETSPASSPSCEKGEEKRLGRSLTERGCAGFNANREETGTPAGREGRRRSLRELRHGTSYTGLVSQILPPPLSAGRHLWPLALVDFGCMRSGTLELRPHWDIRAGDLVSVKVVSVDFARHRVVLHLDTSAKERFFRKFRGADTWLKGTVAQILPFGAVLNLAPGIDGLLHISRFPPLLEPSTSRETKHLSRPSVKSRVRVGDEMLVRLVMFDRDRLVLTALSSPPAPPSRGGPASSNLTASRSLTAAPASPVPASPHH